MSNTPATTWSAGKAPAAGTGVIGTAIGQNLEHNGTSPVTVTYTITPTGPPPTNCAGAAVTRTVVVNPSGQVNDPADQVRCNGAATAAVTFTTNRTGGTTTYSWTNSNTSIGLGASGTGNGIASFTATNTGTSPVTATITVTPSFEGCAGTPQSFTITVNPSGQVNDPADQVRCNGAATAAVTFTTNRKGGTTTYSWTNSNTSIGLAASGTGNSIASFTATNTGTAPVTATITVTPSFEGCAGTPQSFTITVNPTPVLSSGLAPADVCSNTPFSYTPTSLTGSTSFSWARSAAAGITPAPTSGVNGISETLRNITSATIPVTYVYTLSANGCPNTQNVVVNIKPEPVIADQSVDVCSGETLVHTILLDNFTNPPDIVTFTWDLPVLSGGLTGGTDRLTPSS
ncbi:MAG: hypothetical protein IH593_08160, partial [Bacteroidales bacterium]|nr:hypothetical protein [Bacteroidales bacterium]